MSGDKEEQRAPAYRVADAVILSRYEIMHNSSGPVQKYLEAIAQLRLPSGASLVSIILFGSAARGAFTANVSDVDVIVVIPDTASQDDRRLIREKVLALEMIHGFRLPPDRTCGWLAKYVERCTGYSLSSFVCMRSDLLSGEITRVLGLSPLEGALVDRIVLAGVIVSAVTVWGEELLSQVPIPTLRRLDVLKALFNFLSAVILSAAVFPLFPNATKYAMAVLKHSLHSCYFCYQQKTASLEEEVEFFGSRMRRRNVLDDLLNRRRRYSPSLAFVLNCLPILVRLHVRTARDNRFPQPVSRNRIL